MERDHTNAKIRILLAAKKLFAEQGYEATTVRQICKEAKSNLALVSYYFGGKESVFFALFDTFFPIADFRFEEEYTDPAAEIKRIVEKLVKFKIEQPELVAIVQQEAVMNSPRMAGLSKYIYPVYRRLRKMLEEGQEQGIFTFKSIDSIMVSIMAIISFPMNSAFVNPLLSEGKQKTDNLLSDTLNFVLDGLGYTG